MNDSYHGNIISGCVMTPQLIQCDLKLIFDDYSKLSNPQHIIGCKELMYQSIACHRSVSFGNFHKGYKTKLEICWGASMELSYIIGPGGTTNLNVSLNETLTVHDI